MWDRGVGLAVGKRQAPAGHCNTVGRTPQLRGKEGAHPSECRCVERRQETGTVWPIPSSVVLDNWPGAWTRKRADVGRVSL